MLSQTEAISGLGGIGKTQTALEYAHRYRENYGAVLWVTAETEQTLNTGFSDIARILELAEKDGDPYQRKAIVHWLQSQQHWLLIFDNADNPDLLRDFLPRQHRGDVLLTSRAWVFDSLGLFIQPIELEELSSGDATPTWTRPLARIRSFKPEAWARELAPHRRALRPARPRSRRRGPTAPPPSSSSSEASIYYRFAEMSLLVGLRASARALQRAADG